MTILLASLNLGCSSEPAAPKSQAASVEQQIATNQSMNELQAAELAAKLANAECERLYHRQPFTATSFTARIIKDRYEWGRLDPVGVKGFSAVVDFGLDGDDPRVTVYYSIDINENISEDPFP
ncbi:MAG: hypothetical protein SGI88_05725 [Candidatus Hydrogenedentes bacterium]|nr:hypothetical protein [Candidatus Hydrogenedentota bacterium]